MLRGLDMPLRDIHVFASIPVATVRRPLDGSVHGSAFHLLLRLSRFCMGSKGTRHQGLEVAWWLDKCYWASNVGQKQLSICNDVMNTSHGSEEAKHRQ